MGKMREKKKKKKKKKNLIETGNGDECSMNRSPFSLVWFGFWLWWVCGYSCSFAEYCWGCLYYIVREKEKRECL